MRNSILTLVAILSLTGLVLAQSAGDFDDHFIDKTMRLDYFHIGNAKEEFITLDQVYQQGLWAGSKKNLIDHFDNGRYYIKVYDTSSGKLIFSKGFDCYFGEYKTTDSALEGVKRTYHESAIIPYPKAKITFTLEVRDHENRLGPLFSQKIDPDGVAVIKEKLEEGVRVFEMVKHGHPHQKVDIAFIAEGYTKQEEAKVKADLERFTKVFFNHEPYKTYKNHFNIYGVFKPSAESGCDEPTHGIFKNTALSSSFNSLGSPRYLLTEDNKALQDIAAHVPYDALFIMINQKRYGGGGIYNFFCTFTTDNQWWEYLFLHEFGHSFAGLGDEYYTSSVAYNEFYPRGVEPTEPNITALLDPENLKWKKIIASGIEIPTPWGKEAFDKMDLDYQKVRRKINQEIARMKREAAPQEEIEELEEKSEQLSRGHANKMDDYLRKSKFWEKVGAFEGAGYSAQGLFRPMIDCLMFTKGKKPFCRVCQQAVVKIIKHYSE
ncbi:MAG: peptidase M64 [Candidatus Aminicenantes bacterium]|nr:peptidase M64 [Candidatus Aminicenantes bacterium]